MVLQCEILPVSLSLSVFLCVCLPLLLHMPLVVKLIVENTFLKSYLHWRITVRRHEIYWKSTLGDSGRGRDLRRRNLGRSPIITMSEPASCTGHTAGFLCGCSPGVRSGIRSEAGWDLSHLLPSSLAVIFQTLSMHLLGGILFYSDRLLVGNFSFLSYNALSGFFFFLDGNNKEEDDLVLPSRVYLNLEVLISLSEWQIETGHVVHNVTETINQLTASSMMSFWRK